MAYTLANLQTDIRSYTEVSSTVLSDSVLDTIIKNSENKIYREVDSDQDRFYATSNCIVGNRYVTIPEDLRFIRYVQLKDQEGNQYYLEQSRPLSLAGRQALQALSQVRYRVLTQLPQIAKLQQKTGKITPEVVMKGGSSGSFF